MAKKVVRITESQLSDLVSESVVGVLNEIDAKTYARVHRETNRARLDNQNGKYIHQVTSSRSETNDDIIIRGIDLEPRAADSMISPFKAQYMFYCKNLRQNVGITLFTLEKLFELTSEKAVLKGNIVFNQNVMNGSIIVNMDNGNVVYYHSSSKKKYPLEIDNRFKAKWDKLVSTLQEASKLI